MSHTMAMNFLVYAIGILGSWAVGFGLQMGGVGALAALGHGAGRRAYGSAEALGSDSSGRRG